MSEGVRGVPLVVCISDGGVSLMVCISGGWCVPDGLYIRWVVCPWWFV